MNLILIFYNSLILKHQAPHPEMLVGNFFFPLSQHRKVGSGTHLKWLVRKGAVAHFSVDFILWLVCWEVDPNIAIVPLSRVFCL